MSDSLSLLTLVKIIKTKNLATPLTIKQRIFAIPEHMQLQSLLLQQKTALVTRWSDLTSQSMSNSLLIQTYILTPLVFTF